jgi:hypothetical protein
MRTLNVSHSNKEIRWHLALSGRILERRCFVLTLLGHTNGQNWWTRRIALKDAPDAHLAAVLIDFRRAAAPPSNTLTELRRLAPRLVGTGRPKVFVGTSSLLDVSEVQ